MDSGGDPCARCGVRSGTPLCAICARAGVLRWHAGDLRTWVPAACALALVVTALAISVCTAGLLLATHLAPRAPSMAPLDLARLGAQTWWIGLGAPASLSVEASVVADGAVVPVGTFAGQIRVASLLGLAPAGLALLCGGALLAARLGAAAEIEHLVAGALLGLPCALVSAAAASLLPLRADALRVGDATGGVALAVSPLHAAAVALLWATALGALGALVRYAVRTRGLERRWAGLGRAAWPPLAGGGAALVVTALLATLGSVAQWPTLGHATVGAALGVDSEVSSTKTLAQEGMATAAVALGTTPLSLDMGAPVEGRIVVGVPAEQADDFADLPTDTQLRVSLRSGIRASDAVGRVEAATGGRAWLALGLLAGVLAGAAAAGLAPRRRWSGALGAAAVYATGAVALAAWMGAWATGRLLFAGAEPPGLDLWAAWQASLGATLLGSLLLAIPGALVGAALRSRD